MYKASEPCFHLVVAVFWVVMKNLRNTQITQTTWWKHSALKTPNTQSTTETATTRAADIDFFYSSDPNDPLREETNKRFSLGTHNVGFILRAMICRSPLFFMTCRLGPITLSKGIGFPIFPKSQ